SLFIIAYISYFVLYPILPIDLRFLASLISKPRNFILLSCKSVISVFSSDNSKFSFALKYFFKYFRYLVASSLVFVNMTQSSAHTLQEKQVICLTSDISYDNF